MSNDAAWRLFTGAAHESRDAISTEGPNALVRPLLEVRGIIV
jgi:hypothetical protein